MKNWRGAPRNGYWIAKRTDGESDFSNGRRPLALPGNGMTMISTYSRMAPLSAASSRQTPRRWACLGCGRCRLITAGLRTAMRQRARPRWQHSLRAGGENDIRLSNFFGSKVADRTDRHLSWLHPDITRPAPGNPPNSCSRASTRLESHSSGRGFFVGSARE